MKSKPFDLKNRDTWPKDGQRILAFGIWQSDINGSDFNPEWYICTFRHDRNNPDFPDFDVEGGTYYSCWLKTKTVTHWQPQPKNPIA